MIIYHNVKQIVVKRYNVGCKSLEDILLKRKSMKKKLHGIFFKLKLFPWKIMKMKINLIGIF